MNKVGIATDSHSGILPKRAEELGVKVLPMPFYVEEECYFEGVSITREEFFEYLKEDKKVRQLIVEKDKKIKEDEERQRKIDERLSEQAASQQGPTTINNLTPDITAYSITL